MRCSQMDPSTAVSPCWTFLCGIPILRGNVNSTISGTPVYSNNTTFHADKLFCIRKSESREELNVQICSLCEMMFLRFLYRHRTSFIFVSAVFSLVFVESDASGRPAPPWSLCHRMPSNRSLSFVGATTSSDTGSIYWSTRGLQSCGRCISLLFVPSEPQGRQWGVQGTGCCKTELARDERPRGLFQSQMRAAVPPDSSGLKRHVQSDLCGLGIYDTLISPF